MSPVTTLSIAVTALRRNAMRTALTALGMIIGVAAVIVMVAIAGAVLAAVKVLAGKAEDKIPTDGPDAVK